jgi:hypothetical protein
MKKNQIIYWATTGLFCLMMAFSASQYFMNPEMAEGFKKIGFPDFFRIELGVAKLLGVLALLIPMVPNKIKEWAYAGFGIVLISAAVAHISVPDENTMKAVISVVVFGIVLAVSNIYLYKKDAA